jgi:hypothetical protein
MPPSQRILAAYEQRLRKLADDLIAEKNPPAEERGHLLLVVRLVQAVVNAYESQQLDQAVALEAAMSVVSGSSPQRVLNVSLRRLVDDNLMTPWYARFLNSSLGLKRTTIISGGPNVGKSTLLNALIDLLPRDHRIVAVDDSDEGLPVLRDRSFTVHLKAKRGTPARTTVFGRAADMKPTWLVAGELARRDGPVFLEALAGVTSGGGLTTVQTMDPESTLNEWLASSRVAADHIKKLNPLIVHLVREAGGVPHVEKVIEVTTDRGNLVVTPREQVDTEQVGVQGGERSPLARNERDAELARR